MSLGKIKVTIKCHPCLKDDKLILKDAEIDGAPGLANMSEAWILLKMQEVLDESSKKLKIHALSILRKCLCRFRHERMRNKEIVLCISVGHRDREKRKPGKGSKHATWRDFHAACLLPFRSGCKPFEQTFSKFAVRS